MGKKLKVLTVVIGVSVQIAAGIMFGFSEIPVSEYIYMAVWCVCGIVISHALKERKAI